MSYNNLFIWNDWIIWGVILFIIVASFAIILAILFSQGVLTRPSSSGSNIPAPLGSTAEYYKL